MCSKIGMAMRTMSRQARATNRPFWPLGGRPGIGPRHPVLPLGFRGLLGLLGGMAVALVGCGSRPEPPSAVAKVPAVRLDLVDHEALMARVAAHHGTVVVLDCWSTSCPPCVQEFPGLVALAARHPGTVACLSLAFDFDGVGRPEDAVPAVREFLEGVGARGIENLLSGEEADAMYRKLELDSVPAVYVWKPDGTLARRFDAEDSRQRLGRPFTYADVEREVRSLLAP